ncbi:cytochrome b561 [Streptomyces sp. KO7888]|uniref:cytochrome b n=1 Tax=Streptomyces sp. KO7888 TaxID=2602737 RepID=UPI0013F62B25|nr:cytochrome b/b6 domain-containing protein [Streptomyces sp. KO7888]NHI11973.1 cytochrome b561 [Streptomyces sp. KO7888]
MTDAGAGAGAPVAESPPDPQGPGTDVPDRFTLFSRWLHWVMAVLVVAMIFIGAAMVASLADYRLLVSVHKPLGMAVLLLAVVRLVNRFLHRAPPHPRSMGTGERRAALASECLMYGLMVSQPLVGWAMVSASDTPFTVLGVRVPPIAPADPGVYSALHETHLVLGYALFILFTLHMLAVLVHVLVLRDGLLGRMALWRTSRQEPVAVRRDGP